MHTISSSDPVLFLDGDALADIDAGSLCDTLGVCAELEADVDCGCSGGGGEGGTGAAGAGYNNLLKASMRARFGVTVC